MSNFPRGSEWRRWDLHVHTPGTLKNDQFVGRTLQEKWDKYYEAICSYIEGDTYTKSIAVIGVTDYISIDNYKNLISDGKLPPSIKLVVPNVEMRISPITASGTPINIHCLFDPAIANELENRFFAKLKFKSGKTNYSAAKSELIRFGRDFCNDSDLDECSSLKKAREQFVISFENLKSIFDEDTELRNQTIIVVSNNSSDGASGCVNHYDFFIDNEDGSHDSQLRASRESVYKLSDAIFSAKLKDKTYFSGNGTDTKEKVIHKCGSLKPCLHGSDAHTNSKIFNPDMKRYCWIKADPTFSGLKQALNEPEDRFFIGEEPEVLARVSSDKTRYINSVYISTCEGKESTDHIWFKDLSIPISKELTVIIGNKGSGKSAIADIIGLCADARHHDHFLFLDDSKFRKKGLAERFYASLEFESGNKTKVHKLDYNIIDTDEPKVQYLPQNYFDIICNEIDEATSFREEIENVVFQYIPLEESLSAKSFKELILLKATSVEEEISFLESQIHDLNKKIILLEDKSNKLYRKKIESKLKAKTEELIVHDSNRPQNSLKEPLKDGFASKVDAVPQQPPEIIEWKQKLSELTTKVTELEHELVSNNLSIETLSQLKREITSFGKKADEFKKSKTEICQKFNLDISKLLSVSIDVSQIDDILQQYSNRNAFIESSLGTENIDNLLEFENLSLRAQMRKCELNIASIQKSLSDTEQMYQKYLSNLKKWEENRASLIGDLSKPDSIKYYEAEINYIDNDLSLELDTKRNERIELSFDIYLKKSEIKSFYDQIRNAISMQLSKCKVQNLTIESSLVLSSDFIESFLGYINKNKSGSFYGNEDGMKYLKKNILDNIDWNNEQSVFEFFPQVIESLENDNREGIKDKDRARFIGDQVKNREDFYDFLFSLRYLKTVYELQKDGKNIESLSPGEKGALLLVFYLVLDKSTVPLIIDQPEDNLDNNSVAKILVPFIREAKKRRQIIMVTHNPNLAVVADAEQVIRVNIRKDEGNKFSFISGSIENQAINQAIVDILEGTMPAFTTRKNKYHHK